MVLGTRVLSWRTRMWSSGWYWAGKNRLTDVRKGSASAAAWTSSRFRASHSMLRMLAWFAAQAAFAFLVAGLIAVAAYLLGEQLLTLVAAWTSAHDWIVVLLEWLGRPPSTSNHQTIVTTALTVTGTLVTVYFATVTFVMSSTYKDATQRVRDLVTRSPGGRLYGFVYVLVLLYGLVLLTWPTTGRELNGLMFAIMLVLCGLVLLSFGKLRVQLYGLLEPAGLLSQVSREFEWWTRQAVPSAARDLLGRDASFARLRAAESLAVLRDLCRLIRDREPKTSTVPSEFANVDHRAVMVSRALHDTWMTYAAVKRAVIRIPGWCPLRAEHGDWLVGDSNQVTIALNTSTQLRPKPADDTAWVERQLAGLLAEHLSGRDAGSLGRLVLDYGGFVRDLVKTGMFQEARLWMGAVVAPAKKLTGEPAEAEQDLTGLVDFVAEVYTQAVLGLRDHAGHLSLNFPQWTVRQAHGEDLRFVGPRTAGLIANVRDGFAFERQVEGRLISSDVDVAQLTARTMSAEVVDEVIEWMIAFEVELLPWANTAGGDDPSVAAAALSRVDEAVHKWELTLDVVSKLFELCESEHRNVDDQWPNLSLDELRSRVCELEQQLRLPIARLTTRVETSISPNRPDMFGWAFQRAHEDLLDDVLSDRAFAAEDLDGRLRQLVVATERAHFRLRQTVHRQHHTVLGSVWSEPHLMLYQVSGVAFALSLVGRRSDIFEVFAGVWKRLLDADPQKVIDAAVTTLGMDSAILALTPGGLRRTIRQMKAQEALSDMEIVLKDMAPRVKRLMRFLSIRSDFEDAFVAGWLAPQALQRGAVLPEPLPRRLADLLRSLPNEQDDS